MKHLAFLWAVSLLLSGCCSTEPVPQDPDQLTVVGTFDEATSTVKATYLAGQRDTFEDGTKVEKAGIELQVDTYYLVREGHAGEKQDCRMSRTPLKPTKEGFFTIDMRAQGTETCAGDGCSQCAFKDGGGCTCKTSTNNCNHTISRNRDLYL